jgi:hypothetical protein
MNELLIPKGKNIGRVLSLLGVLIAAGKLQAQPTVDWVSDSYSSFDVILSGTGPGWSGTVTSPSGLWQLSSGNEIAYPSGITQTVFIENTGMATFLGQLPPQDPAPNPSALPPDNTPSLSTFGGYQDFFSPVAPIHDGIALTQGYLAALSPEGWRGMSSISVTSIPNVNDTSTWTWMAEYEASGVSLAPEPNTSSVIALGAVAGIACGFFKRRKPVFNAKAQSCRDAKGH